MPLIAPAPLTFDPVLDFPRVRALEPLRFALVEREYHSAAIDEVLGFVHRFGSLCCCPLVFECDRDALEEHVPDAPEAEWAAFGGTWELGPSADAALVEAARSWEAPS